MRYIKLKSVKHAATVKNLMVATDGTAVLHLKISKQLLVTFKNKDRS